MYLKKHVHSGWFATRSFFKPIPMTNHIPWLQRLDEFILTNVGTNNLTNQELAAASRVSERQLHRKIKAHTGYSTQRYIRKKKLELAMAYLKKGRYRTVKETASAVGYSNSSHFIQLFEQEYGQKPYSVLQAAGWR